MRIFHLDVSYAARAHPPWPSFRSAGRGLLRKVVVRFSHWKPPEPQDEKLKAAPFQNTILNFSANSRKPQEPRNHEMKFLKQRLDGGNSALVARF